MYHPVQLHEILHLNQSNQIIHTNSMSRRPSTYQEYPLHLLNHHCHHLFQADLEVYQMHHLQFQLETPVLTHHLPHLHEQSIHWQGRLQKHIFHHLLHLRLQVDYRHNFLNDLLALLPLPSQMDLVLLLHLHRLQCLVVRLRLHHHLHLPGLAKGAHHRRRGRRLQLQMDRLYLLLNLFVVPSYPVFVVLEVSKLLKRLD
jgi:hypothetical protein